ncbi:sodium:proton antiporter NhaD [Desulfobacterales bacterium HSG17]|nr:sodium:proton antiporter NhaD [Desulfobacterales bacterium HSG17]
MPAIAMASGGGGESLQVDMTGTFYGLLALNIFVFAYALVPLENNIHLRKSKPVVLAAGVIWVLVALAYAQIGDTHTPHDAIKHNFVEYAELFLFLLAAMTYINSMEERNVFETLRAYLVTRQFSLRKIFWITGVLAFFISPIADNLTTALLMGAVVMAVGRDNTKFVALACINVVVAANAGGAFSPFGDITTLMVWQKGKVQFAEFFAIAIPSAVNWLVPAIIMSFYVSKETPKITDDKVVMKFGAKRIVFLFLMTIVTAVSFHNFLHLPPAAGMMLGLGYLGIFSYYIKRVEGRADWYDSILGTRREETMHPLFPLRKSGTSVSDAMADIKDPAFAIDEKHIVTHWNKAIEKLTGVSAKEQIGSQMQWAPFYDKERPTLADMVLDNFPATQIDNYYDGKNRKNTDIDEAYDAIVFLPEMGGEEGKWLSLSAAPVKDENGDVCGVVEAIQDLTEMKKETSHFDLMKKIARAEWDTLLFFYGVILCVGGLSQFGYLGFLSSYMYSDLGPTIANSLVGVLSAIVDNIPVMFAVLTMDPPMSHGQWLLVTLTAGVGGSLLSIGSAAGVALMGTARGTYTFGAHLKWTPVIAIGYILSILCHLFINASKM